MDDRTNYSSRRRDVYTKTIEMLKLFKRKSEVDKLREKHRKLLAEAHALSSVNRRQSDEKIAESEAILKRIQEIVG